MDEKCGGPTAVLSLWWAFRRCRWNSMMKEVVTYFISPLDFFFFIVS